MTPLENPVPHIWPALGQMWGFWLTWGFSQRPVEMFRAHQYPPPPPPLETVLQQLYISEIRNCNKVHDNYMIEHAKRIQQHELDIRDINVRNQERIDISMSIYVQLLDSFREAHRAGKTEWICKFNDKTLTTRRGYGRPHTDFTEYQKYAVDYIVKVARAKGWPAESESDCYDGPRPSLALGGEDDVVYTIYDKVFCDLTKPL